MTVFGILAAGNARRVRATVSDDPGAVHVSTRLAPVAPAADRTLGLRFAAIALPGSHCIERLATENAVGEALWRGTTGDLCGR